jgi:hypothetical protein
MQLLCAICAYGYHPLSARARPGQLPFDNTEMAQRIQGTRMSSSHPVWPQEVRTAASAQA